MNRWIVPCIILIVLTVSAVGFGVVQTLRANNWQQRYESASEISAMERQNMINNLEATTTDMELSTNRVSIANYQGFKNSIQQHPETPISDEEFSYITSRQVIVTAKNNNESDSYLQIRMGSCACAPFNQDLPCSKGASSMFKTLNFKQKVAPGKVYAQAILVSSKGINSATYTCPVIVEFFDNEDIESPRQSYTRNLTIVVR